MKEWISSQLNHLKSQSVYYQSNNLNDQNQNNQNYHQYDQSNYYKEQEQQDEDDVFYNLISHANIHLISSKYSNGIQQLFQRLSFLANDKKGFWFLKTEMVYWDVVLWGVADWWLISLYEKKGWGGREFLWWGVPMLEKFIFILIFIIFLS